MMKTTAALAAGMIALFGVQAAQATQTGQMGQTADASASAPVTRAEVKSEASTAVKSGDTAMGNVSNTDTPPKKNVQHHSSKKRSKVKSEASNAVESGATGVGNVAPGDVNHGSGASVNTRADVKSDAKAANKTGAAAKGNQPEQ